MTLADKIKDTFPAQIHFPVELQMFCEWIEANGYDGIATDFRLEAAPYLISTYFENGEKLERYLVAFGHSGDGGIFAIWQIDGEQKIVHLGSEGNNWFVVADSFVGFLAKLAIVHRNLAHDDLQKPPAESNADTKFKTWVVTTFGLTVPDSAKEIDNTDKAFTRWLFNILQPGVDFEHFDPDSKHNLEFHSIEYRLVVSNIPDNKSKFIGDLRKVSAMSISELMQELRKIPVVVYESSTYFNGQLSLKNFPTKDKEALLYLTEKYRQEVVLQYRKRVKQSENMEFREIP